jgi:transcriptional regulator with GAF, ATPase, and Fis domain
VVEREQLLTRTFVELADNLVVEFDVVDVLTTLATRTVALLSVDAAAILLGDEEEQLHVVAASGEAAPLLGLFDLQAKQGPALECYRSGIPQAADDVLAISRPALGQSIAAYRFQTMNAMPMRLRSHVIGVLSLLGNSNSQLDDADLVVAQALADVATISVLQYRALQDGRILASQLKEALTSRVVIEQAKGVLSERWRTTMDDAFDRLRRYARGHNEHLSEVARRVTTGELGPDQLVGPPAS